MIEIRNPLPLLILAALLIAPSARVAAEGKVVYTGPDGSTGHECNTENSDPCDCGTNDVGECVIIWKDGFESPCQSCETVEGVVRYTDKKPPRRYDPGLRQPAARPQLQPAARFQFDEPRRVEVRNTKVTTRRDAHLLDATSPRTLNAQLKVIPIDGESAVLVTDQSGAVLFCLGPEKDCGKLMN